jgi:hypothetical protein
MTPSEVEAVMGSHMCESVRRNGGDYFITMHFGRSQETKQQAYDTLREWSGDAIPAWSVPYEDWPVRVRFDRRPPDGRVDLIERGSEVESKP